MRSTLDELRTELGELRALVASIAPVNEALAEHHDSLVQQYVSIRRRFDYAAFAVALYSSFEKFVENLAAAYIRLESKRVKYAALPQKLTNKHLVGTAEVILRGRLGEGRYAGMSELAAVKNLFECLSGATSYLLNEAVVIAHDANLRAGEVDAIFAAIGIEQICERARKADALVDWYCAAVGLDSPPQDGVKRTVIEERLKDVVERRNQVAHRGGNPVNLLGVDEMNEAIGFIEALSHSVFAMTAARYLRDHRVSFGIQLTQRQGSDPMKKGKVVIVDPPGHRLFRGQPVFVIVETTGARWGRIQSIQLDGAAVDAVNPGIAVPNGIGINLNFKCPKDTNLIALADEDDVVWSPMEEATVPAA